MKFTLIIPQAGVVGLGLVGKIGLAELCLLDYLKGWFFSPKARRITVGGAEFVWVRYERAVEEMPLLFRPEATIATRKNQVVRLVQNLRSAGLIQTARAGRDLYFHQTELAARVSNWREPAVRKALPTVSPGHDETVTRSDDHIITTKRDDSPATIITETATTEPNTSETNPVSPSGVSEVAPNSSGCSISEQAEALFRLYPKQVEKIRALRAIVAQLKHHKFEFLAERTKRFAASCPRELRYVPNPARWYREELFNDPLPASQPAGASGKQTMVPLRQFDPAQYNQPLTEF